MLAPILGSGSMLLLDGAEHLRQRRLLLPPFHGERMRGYGTLMSEVAERHVAAWPRRRRFAVLPSMQAITLEIIMRAVFGVDDRDRRERIGAPLRRLLDMVGSRRRVLAAGADRGAHRTAEPLGALRRRARRGGRAALRRDPRPRVPTRTAPPATTSSRCCWPRATRTAIR